MTILELKFLLILNQLTIYGLASIQINLKQYVNTESITKMWIDHGTFRDIDKFQLIKIFNCPNAKLANKHQFKGRIKSNWIMLKSFYKST